MGIYYLTMSYIITFQQCARICKDVWIIKGLRTLLRTLQGLKYDSYKIKREVQDYYKDILEESSILSTYINNSISLLSANIYLFYVNKLVFWGKWE